MAKAPVKKNSSAIKRTKQSILRRSRNISILSGLKTQEKKLLQALSKASDTTTVKEVYITFVSMLDKAVKKNVLSSNKANRKKSTLNRRVATLA